MEKSLYCETCKKYYKSYQSLWNHKKRFHPQNILILPQSTSILPQNNSFLPQNNSDKLTCRYCDKKYSRQDNLNRHYQTCKLKIEEDIRLHKQEEENKQLRKDNDELRKMVEDLLKIKTSIINSHNTNNTNNTNNGTINNITIVPFGKENFVEVSTEDERLLILKEEGNNVLYKCIEMKHFNEKYPQFHNYMRTNNRTNEAKIYDDKIGDFKTVNKNEIVDDVIMNAEFDIDDMYELHVENINEKHKYNVRRIIDESQTPEYVENHVNQMAYDYRNRIIKTHNKNKVGTVQISDMK
jgi:hypothetical protein